MKILLDTNAYTRFALGHRPLADTLEYADELYLSTVVLGELWAGFRLGGQTKENLTVLQEFIDTVCTAVLDITQEIADRYSEVFVFLRRNGCPIPTNDIWIAAAALETGARLITYDGHFQKIPGLITLAP